MTTDEEIEIVLRHLQILRVEPGDTLVLRHPNRVSQRVAEQIRGDCKRIFGDKHRIVLLEDGMEMGVVRGAPDVGVEGE